jgi:hypothetical protein
MTSLRLWLPPRVWWLVSDRPAPPPRAACSSTHMPLLLTLQLGSLPHSRIPTILRIPVDTSTLADVQLLRAAVIIAPTPSSFNRACSLFRRRSGGLTGPWRPLAQRNHR